MITLFIVLKEQLTVSVDDLASLHYLIFASHSSSIINRFKVYCIYCNLALTVI